MLTGTTVHPSTTINEESASDLHGLSISHSVLSLVPYSLAVEFFVVPVGVDESGCIDVLMADPYDIVALQNVQLHTGASLRPAAASRDQILGLIERFYSPVMREKAALELKNQAENRFVYNASSSVITVVNDILHEAIRLKASDIHLEPFEHDLCVRYRIDGVLQEITAIPKERIAEVVSRVKIMSRIDIAEKRRSQDGRIRITDNGQDVDIRVSTLPTDFGEKTVLRLLDKNSNNYTLDSIGMEPGSLALFKNAIRAPNGIVLITGPTGSGKTTTLYGVINQIKRPGVNISTVEDPIEYNITGVNQTQVNTMTGMTFAHSLRTLLRQDPDIIMVGEMRDQETAEIAIRSSLTGHLVLSTLHTNDAPAAVTRLIDMGIEPYLVSSSVTLIVAQRLLRKICTHCKCETDIHEDTRRNLGLSTDIKLYKGLGCTACGHTGYRGRTGIYEILPVTDTIRALINRKAYVSEIRDQALKEGLVLLRDHALSKLVDGITSCEEVLREVSVIS